MPQEEFELCESDKSYVVKTRQKEYRFPSNKKVPLPEKNDFTG